MVEDSILLTRISSLAHSLDKRWTTREGTRESLLAGPGRELGALLEEWSRRHPEPDPRVAWAREVLEVVKKGGIPEARPIAEQSPCDILSIIHDRRSVRKWVDRDVPPELIERMLEAARWAPSSCNRQSVRLVVLRSQSCKQSAARLNAPFIAKAPVVILVGVDLRVYGRFEWYATHPYLDAAAAIQNMLLVGHAAGLGCLWAQAGLERWRMNPRAYYQAKRELNLPGWFRPVSLVAVGYPAYKPKAPPRHEIGEFVCYEDEGFPDGSFPEWRLELPVRLRRWASGFKRALWGLAGRGRRRRR